MRLVHLAHRKPLTESHDPKRKKVDIDPNLEPGGNEQRERKDVYIVNYESSALSNHFPMTVGPVPWHGSLVLALVFCLHPGPLRPSSSAPSHGMSAAAPAAMDPSCLPSPAQILSFAWSLS